jgi:hypothetical protein
LLETCSAGVAGQAHTKRLIAACLCSALLAGQSAVLAQNPEETSSSEERAVIAVENQPIEPTWIDTSHAYASDQAQALTEWMDDFFGDQEYNLEQAKSHLRIELIDDWESQDGHDMKIRLRGKMQLPKISKRLDLVFSGEQSDLDDETDRQLDHTVGLQYKLNEGVGSRWDLTLGYASGNLRPGLKFRAEGSIDSRNSYRFIERIQYEDDKGPFSTSQFDLNHSLDENNIVRWGSRALWGKYSEGVEWRTGVTLRNRYNPQAQRPVVLGYSASVSGATRPNNHIKNYRLGVKWRRQILRNFLYLELEPAYNYRKKNIEDNREGVFSFDIKLEIALERDLRRKEHKSP